MSGIALDTGPRALGGRNATGDEAWPAARRPRRASLHRPCAAPVLQGGARLLDGALHVGPMARRGVTIAPVRNERSGIGDVGAVGVLRGIACGESGAAGRDQRHEAHGHDTICVHGSPWGSQGTRRPDLGSRHFATCEYGLRAPASWRQAPEPLHRAEKGRARDGNREQFDALKCFEVPTPNPLRDSLSEQRFPHLPRILNLAGARRTTSMVPSRKDAAPVGILCVMGTRIVPESHAARKLHCACSPWPVRLREVTCGSRVTCDVAGWKERRGRCARSSRRSVARRSVIDRREPRESRRDLAVRDSGLT